VKLALLDRRATDDDVLAPPLQCLVHISGFQHPKTAYVLLGLQVRPVRDEYLTTGLCARSDFAFFTGCRPPTKTLILAAIISSLSTSISRPMASSSTDGS
jgi:hypothetical protein